jgi:hypothetical protein
MAKVAKLRNKKFTAASFVSTQLSKLEAKSLFDLVVIVQPLLFAHLISCSKFSCLGAGCSLRIEYSGNS